MFFQSGSSSDGKLPAALVGVGEAACFRRQRHSQKQAQVRVAGNHKFRDGLEILARLLLGPEARPGRQHLQAQGTAAVTHHLMANIAADVLIRALFQEDGLDARFEKFVVQLRGLRIAGPGRLPPRSAVVVKGVNT